MGKAIKNVKMGKAITHASKKAPWSILKFGKHFIFYLAGRGSHHKRCDVCWSMCVYIHKCIPNLLNILIIHGLNESNVLEKNTTINYLYLNRGGKNQENTCFSLFSHCFLYKDSWSTVSLESNSSTHTPSVYRLWISYSAHTFPRNCLH